MVPDFIQNMRRNPPIFILKGKGFARRTGYVKEHQMRAAQEVYDTAVRLGYEDES